MTDLRPDEIIAIAIRNEEAAAAFYRQVADLQTQQDLRDVFLDFSREEVRHKERLLQLEISDLSKIETKKVIDLKIAETLTLIEPRDGMDYGDALAIGMKREKEAYLFYRRLSETTDDMGLKNLFNSLAQEEAAHKLWFETEYDEFILLEN